MDSRIPPAFAPPLVIAERRISSPDEAANFGIRLTGPADRRNVIIVDDSVRSLDLIVNFIGWGNTLVLGKGCNLVHGSQVTLEGSDGTAFVCGGGGSSKANLTLRGEKPLIYYGADTTANQVDILAHGTSAIIGPGCLLSWGITIRTYDSHAIIDIATKTQINAPKPVSLGKNVWIGQNAIIMPGVSVGDGAIVGAGSIVTKRVAPRSLAVGAPAKEIRSGVTWAREPFASPAVIERVIAASS